MKRNDFDARLAHHLRSICRETCSEADVHEYALMSIANAAALAFYMKTEPTVIHCPASSASWTNFRNDFEGKRLDADMSRSGR